MQFFDIKNAAKIINGIVVIILVVSATDPHTPSMSRYIFIVLQIACIKRQPAIKPWAFLKPNCFQQRAYQ